MFENALTTILQTYPLIQYFLIYNIISSLYTLEVETRKLQNVFNVLSTCPSRTYHTLLNTLYLDKHKSAQC